MRGDEHVIIALKYYSRFAPWIFPTDHDEYKLMYGRWDSTPETLTKVMRTELGEIFGIHAIPS